MRFGAKVLNYGAGATMQTVLDQARRAEEAGFDSVWLGDHLAIPERNDSYYPYSADGKIDWDPEEPWLEPVVVLAALAAVTSRPRLGVAVLVAPLREPIGLAKQLACVTQLSGGRLVLGVGDGWLREELELVGEDFRRRRERTDEVLAICKEVWSGSYVAHRASGDLRFLTHPTPERPVPVFLGGSSEATFRRVAHRGYGWLPLHHGKGACEVVREGLARVARWRERAGLPRTSPPEVVLNAGHAAEIAPELAGLAAEGVGEVLIDGEFEEPDGPRRALELARDAVS
ncbi:MAG: TIGR03619 family F420-dependent LLM class oxidoreductase [Actinomycetota bacterium]|nr:TIGR03619 family F420-dependent LLM class oxidoreductase [Actinomycetota bacterium]